MTQSLQQVAQAMVAPGKGILAADESEGTIAKRFADDGVVPNNRALPVVVYRGALAEAGGDRASRCERMFAEHDWPGERYR